MILYHYTEKPFYFNPYIRYKPDTRESFKPVGLWLSDESNKEGWKSWCEDSQWGLNGLKYETKFELRTKHCLWLQNYKDIEEFSNQYKIADKYPSLWRIDWPKVQKEHQGILITPYCWDARFNFMWYYGWDCASACVWDLSLIEVVSD